LLSSLLVFILPNYSVISILTLHLLIQLSFYLTKYLREVFFFYFILKKAFKLRLLEPLDPPIDELRVPLDEFNMKRQATDFITVSIDKLRKHRKGKHSIAWKGNRSAIGQRVKVQTFFRARSLRRYFIVNAAGGNSESSLSSEVASVVSEQLAAWNKTKQKHDEEAKVMEAETAQGDWTWCFMRTGWAQASRRLAPSQSCASNTTTRSRRSEAAAGRKAGRAACGEKCQGSVDARTRDATMAEERKAIRGGPAADGSTAEPGESSSTR
jgi:hypothetical protein